MRSAVMLRSRLIPGLGAATLAVVLAACGSSTATDSSSSSSPSAGSAAKVRIAFVYDTTSENFAQEMSLGAAAAKATGVTLTNTAPPTASGSQQVQLFQAAEQTSKNGIALATLFPDLFIRPFKQAESASIPTIAVDAPPAAGAAGRADGAGPAAAGRAGHPGHRERDARAGQGRDRRPASRAGQRGA
ncbi:MAG: substrate-binding domain-containing protein [Streptosporangiaceae bacterium]